MKKSAAVLFLMCFGLFAAEVWQKPLAQWSEKDAAKIMSSSPWAKTTSLTMDFGGGGGMPPPGGGGGFGGGGGRGGGAPQGQSEGFGGGGFSVMVTARMESALPIREALVRTKFGADAEKSEDAKKVLSDEPKSYEVVLSGGLGGFVMGPPDQVKEHLTESTTLSSARGTSIKPETIQIGPPGKTMDVLFVFPRTMPFTVDDQEVEFATKLGKSNVKIKFKLKDMVVNGKLEM